MSKKQHVDDFLRERLANLPDAKTAGFAAVQQKIAVKKQRRALVFLLVPAIALGIYWFSQFTEQDLMQMSQPADQKIVMPSNAPQHQETIKPASTEQAPANQIARPTTNSESGNAQIEQQATPENSVNMVPKNTAASAVATQNKTPKTQATVASSEIAKGPSIREKRNTSATKNLNNVPAAASRELVFQTENSKAVQVQQQEYALPAVVEVPAFAVPETPSSDKWSLTLNIYPNYTFRDFKISQSQANQVNERYEELINSSEIGGFAFNVSADLRYHLGNDLYVGSGIGFIQSKINGHYNFVIDKKPVVNEKGVITGYVDYPSAVHVDEGIIQTYQFLQFPLHLSYQPWASKKVRLIIEGGMSYIRFLRASGNTLDYAKLFPIDLEKMHYKKNMYSFDFKVGAAYYPRPNVAFGVEPTFSYFNTSLYQDSPIYVVPWSVGLNINVRMRLF